MAENKELAFSITNNNQELVILVHGMTGAPAEMRYQAKKISGKGYDVVCPLLAGHGKDYAQLLQTSWKDWLNSVIDCYDAYAPKYQKVHIAGICVGGMLSIMATLKRKFDSAIVYSPVFKFDGWAMQKFYGLIDIAWPFLYWPFIGNILIKEEYPFGIKNPRLRNIIENSPSSMIDGALDAMPLKSIVNMYRLGQSLLKNAKNVKTPILIIHAKEDDLGTLKNAETLKKQLGKVGHLYILNNSYHMVHVDQEREKVASLCLDFFKNHEVDGEE